MVSEETVIRVRGLVTRFGEQRVHDGFDLDVRRGEILGVVGPSGRASRCCCARSSGSSA